MTWDCIKVFWINAFKGILKSCHASVQTKSALGLLLQRKIILLLKNFTHHFLTCCFDRGCPIMFLLTVDVGNSNKLKDGNNDKRVRGCIGVHKLQHVHSTLRREREKGSPVALRQLDRAGPRAEPTRQLEPGSAFCLSEYQTQQQKRQRNTWSCQPGQLGKALNSSCKMKDWTVVRTSTCSVSNHGIPQQNQNCCWKHNYHNNESSSSVWKGFHILSPWWSSAA